MNTTESLRETLDDIDLIICDFGGVVYEIDFERTTRRLSELPGYNGEKIHCGGDVHDELFVSYDNGEISTPDFRHAMRQKFGFLVDDEALDSAWRALLIAPYDFAHDAVRALRDYSRLVLLSNINGLHVGKVLPDCRHFLSDFDALYFSCRMHRRKPNPGTFLHVCEAQGVKPNRAVLIDDSEANCEAAAALGISTVHLTNTDLLREFATASLARVA